jgi:hypothetical protein
MTDESFPDKSRKAPLSYWGACHAHRIVISDEGMLRIMTGK